jgi:uncharacterized membrane protein
MIRALVAALLVASPFAGSPARQGVVHAVLFYSPMCPHCHKVITEDLPPLQAKYGAALVMAGVDVTTPHGQSLYRSVVDYFHLPESRQGVPTLVVGSEVMVGELEIPTRFPTIIQQGLAAGGIDWPPVPAVRQALAAQGMLEDRPVQGETAPESGSVTAAQDTAAGKDTAAAGAPVNTRDTVAAGGQAPKGAPAAPEVTTPTEAQPSTQTGAPTPTKRPSPAIDTATPTHTAEAAPTSVQPRTGAEAEPIAAAGAEAAPPGSDTTAPTQPRAESGTASTGAHRAEGPPRTPSSSSEATAIGTLPREVAQPGAWARFQLDPVANAIAVLVLMGMLVALGAALRSVAGSTPPALILPSWMMPVLAAVGMAVASYLAMVELTGAVAVCGPVGDCNAVQHSPYAVFFGVRVGVLGQVGYLAMFGAWALGVLGPRRWRDSAWLALWAMALGGVAFSVYLTFLEPFVIGATCVWCLTSAVVMTLMLLGATPPVAAQRK